MTHVSLSTSTQNSEAASSSSITSSQPFASIRGGALEKDKDKDNDRKKKKKKEKKKLKCDSGNVIATKQKHHVCSACESEVPYEQRTASQVGGFYPSIPHHES